MGFFEDIGDELTGFVSWLWNNLGPPERKTWCAAFYFVAQEDAKFEYPETALDQKMAEAVAAVTLAAAGVPDVHVVYRTVPADPINSDPVAKVVKFLGPETGSICFPDCYDPSTLELLDTEKDLTCFLKWVYRWCPADHYAIFIWGHSFGPAGLFEPGSGLKIPKPGLEALKEAFQTFQATRRAGDPPPVPRKDANLESGGVTTLGPSTSDPLDGWANQVDKKVEIVLFQDCWMSTLETAFEIADSTNYMVASQSLLPIGTGYANFVWPYDDLLKALPSASTVVDLANLIVAFYVNHFAQVMTLTTIPIALVRLAKVPVVEPLLKALVQQLATLPAPERKPLLEPARLVRLDETNPYDPILLAGDGALVDLLALCASLKSTAWPAAGSGPAQAAAHQAVVNLEAELQQLVTLTQEAQPAASIPVGFQGVSAFHWPPVGVVTDDYIKAAVRESVHAYRNLELVKKTGWDQLALEHKP